MARIDKRKAGKDVNDAIFPKPNCTTVFYPDVANYGVKVNMGKILDGFSEHMKNYNDNRTFILTEETEPTQKDIVNLLK